MHCTTESLQSPPAPQQSSSLLPDASRSNRLKDFANSEFVNRLLAATRITDFYSAAPHSLFYSDLLRSLVQSRSESSAADCNSQHAAAPYSALAFSSMSQAQQQQHHRRNNRKRLWPNRFSDLHNQRNGNNGGESHDNPPLMANGELKTEKCRKREEKEEYSPEKEQMANSTTVVATEKAIPGLIFPTNPTAPAPWYTAPYPPPPFFIDLRVSGHIYDNEAKPKVSTAAIGPAVRQGSAFTVPLSRNTMAPMNLTTNQGELPTFKDKRADDGSNKSSPDGFARYEPPPPEVDAEDTKRQHNSSYSKMRLGVEEVIAVDDNDT